MDSIHEYYVDPRSGEICSTQTPPDGCHFEFKQKETYREILLVADSDGEVIEEMVSWPSREALEAALQADHVERTSAPVRPR